MSDTSPFAELVVADVRQEANASQAAALRDPEVLDAWRAELTNLLNKIDSQISRKRAEQTRRYEEYIHSVKEFEAWRANALGFRRAAQDKLHEVKGLIRERDGLARLGDGADEILKLRSAIRIHRDAVVKSEPDADTAWADEALWATVDEAPARASSA